MWGQYIGQILTGLAGLITAVGGIVLARTRQVAADLTACQRDSSQREAAQRQWRVTALRHISLLERRLLKTTIAVPDRPDELL